MLYTNYISVLKRVKREGTDLCKIFATHVSKELKLEFETRNPNL